ncbi:MAG: SDR family NAD(P)-dependent oxidoreductase [Candidatus Cyclobacteriaceae bacterium M2_1C_046]
MKDRNVAVITGASSGIGREASLKFAKQGDCVVLVARDKLSLQEVADEFENTQGEAFIIPADVSNEEEVNEIVRKTVERYGKIDIWVNNAAVIAFGEFMDIPSEDFKRIIEVNLFGYIYGVRAVLPQFLKQKRGTLINVSSVAGVVGQPYSVPYSVSKFGIRGLGISLDQELKNEKNIHITTLMPSTVDTPIYRKGANYIGRKIKPPVSVISAEKVGEAILKLSKKPKKNTFVGKQTLLMRLGRFIMPTIFDKIVYYKTIIQEFQDETVQKSNGNLYKSMPKENKIKGGYKDDG